MPNTEWWMDDFEKKHWGAMFECGDYEALLDDVSAIIAEAVRRRDAELLEKVERFKNEIVLSPDIADKTKWNVLEWVIKLIKGE